MGRISYETSQNMLELLGVGEVRSENVFLGDALGRILAEDVVAPEDYPRAPMAAMDGYAIIGAEQAYASLEILGDNPAGSERAPRVVEGGCVKTFTGAPMPEGADTLVPIENVTVEAGTVTVRERVPEGFAVRPAAESYAKGDVLIRAGETIGFVEIGVMAGLNRVMVRVAVRPRVAILATGSEVVDIGVAADGAAQIRSSNSYTLEALARLAGAQPLQMGVVRDERDAIERAFQNALASSDIVVSTGGVSVGDYDFVKEIVPRLGAEVIYQGVNIKPGQHVMVARKGEKFILALPGFAYSSTVTFVLYALPLIRRFLGRCERPPIVEATLRVPFKKRSDKSEFTACNLTFEDGRYWVDFDGKKSGSSAILTNLLGSAALMMSGEDDGDLEAGTAVNVLTLERL